MSQRLYILILLVGVTVASNCTTSPVKTVMWLAPGAEPERVARMHGFRRYLGPVFESIRATDRPQPHEFEVECADRWAGDHDAAVKAVSSARGSARLRQADANVVHEEVQSKRRRYPRPDRSETISAEGYVPRQWHLGDEDVNLASAHVLGVWRQDIFGRGVKIVIVDDGLDVDHRDIRNGYDRTGISANYNSGDPTDPRPTYDDSHGTSAGGVACATGARSPPDAGICGHGVAPMAEIAAIRLIAEPATDSDEARALSHAADKVDIYSCSWGPQDDGATLERPGRLVKEALSDGSIHGRDGKGSLYVWAAGNGAANGDTCAHDGFASNPNVIAVGAVSHLGKAAWYSEGCAALFCTAPSSGDGWSVATTDVAGRRGRSRGDCNDKFGGTSAAAPFVAGGLALILEANPNMSKATVEWALAVSCRKIDPDHPGWSMNSYGFWHNPRYGFGVIDVEEAIGVVQRWMKSGRSFGTRSECVLHPSSDWRLVVPEDACPGMNLIERVQLVITARATRRGDMSFDLVHESGGMVSTFEGRSEDATGRGYVDWSFSSVRHWGERLVPGDVWGLRARSVSGRDTPIVTKWYLRIVGIGPFSPRYDN